MLTKTGPNPDPCGFTAHPPPPEVPIIPDCSFYTFATKLSLWFARPGSQFLMCLKNIRYAGYFYIQLWGNTSRWKPKKVCGHWRCLIIFPLMWRKVAKQQLVPAETPKHKAITRRKLQCSGFEVSLPSWCCFCGSDDPTPPSKQEGNKTYNAEGLGITYFKARGWPWIISSQLFHLVSLQSADLHSITSAQDP